MAWALSYLACGEPSPAWSELLDPSPAVETPRAPGTADRPVGLPAPTGDSTGSVPSTADTGRATAATGDTGALESTADTGLADCVLGVEIEPQAEVANRRILGIEGTTTTWWTAEGESDNELFGWYAHVADFDGDGFTDLFVADIDDNGSAIFGPLALGTWTEGEVASYQITPAMNGQVTIPVDGDGDGQVELLMWGDGVYEWWLLDLPSEQYVGDGSDLPRLATVWLQYHAYTLNFSQPTDMNSDGHLDMWTRVALNGLPVSEWAVTLVEGPLSGTLYPDTTFMARYFFDPATDFTAVGAYEDSIVAWDLDGTGVPDLALGVVGLPAVVQGGVVVVQDPPLVEADLGDVETSRIEAEVAVNRGIGHPLVRVPDMNGDGYGELAFGGGLADYTARGGLYLQYGPPPVGAYSEDCVSLVVESPPPYGGILDLATGDLDGDGVPDLVAQGLGDSGVSEVTVWYGPVATGTADITDADATIAGTDLGGLGDFDGDGIDDLVLNEPYDGVNETGAVHILQGGLD